MRTPRHRPWPQPPSPPPSPPSHPEAAPSLPRTVRLMGPSPSHCLPPILVNSLVPVQEGRFSGPGLTLPDPAIGRTSSGLTSYPRLSCCSLVSHLENGRPRVHILQILENDLPEGPRPPADHSPPGLPLPRGPGSSAGPACPLPALTAPRSPSPPPAAPHSALATPASSLLSQHVKPILTSGALHLPRPPPGVLCPWLWDTAFSPVIRVSSLNVTPSERPSLATHGKLSRPSRRLVLFPSYQLTPIKFYFWA